MITHYRKLKRKSKIQNFLTSASDFFLIFMETSSIHGFSHIVTRKRHPLEYFLWILTVILAGTATVQLNLSKWRQYQDNPTVVSLERNYLDWNTSLPAVSICPEAKLNPSKLEEVIKKFSYVKDEKRLKNFLLSLVFVSYKNFDVFMETFDELKTSDYWKAVAIVKHDLTYSVINSNAEKYDITTMSPFMSESGICYSYNSVVTQYNDPSYWESRNWSIVEAPAAFRGSPLDGDIFAQIMSMNTGYRLYIHAPAEFPDVALSSMVAKNNSFKELEIQALNIYSTEATLQLSIKQRKCRRPEESNLLLSPIYTYNMCRMECRMKKCWELCGCVPYFYRPLENFKICDIKGMKCLSKHKELLVKLRDPKTEKKIKCDCLPQCDEINYLIDSESTMNWDFGTTLKWGVIRYPRLRYKRDIIFGLSDLLGMEELDVICY
ncbi:sodium channel protein Nach-like isoform X2 [Rhodnius prolixus]|uniref:sodium channel protein Nach-like isoform X2 n=1 Tax=Rhodnius prolixus TaxID=13249 RepID=UPI003D18BCE2